MTPEEPVEPEDTDDSTRESDTPAQDPGGGTGTGTPGSQEPGGAQGPPLESTHAEPRPPGAPGDGAGDRDEAGGDERREAEGVDGEATHADSGPSDAAQSDSGQYDSGQSDSAQSDAATPSNPGGARVTDEQWDSIIAAWNAPAGVNSEISTDEIRDRLGEEEGYTPPDPGPIGVHTAPPILVLCWVLAVGGPLVLLLGVLFLRPVPGLLVAGGVVAALAGITGLFWQLPQDRSERGGDGSAV